jgi:hypothetical protein
MDCYILDGHTPVPEPDLMTWAMWMETADRHVAHDADEGTGWRVSTVFLGIDYRHFGKGPPILFETMVFGGPLDGDTTRYCTWDEADAGHTAMLVKVLTALEAKQP